MSDRRDKWRVAGVLHMGDSPLEQAVEIYSVYPITADEAANFYVTERLDDDAQDGDPHCVAVHIRDDIWRLYEMRTCVETRVEVVGEGDRKAEDFS